VLCNKCFVFFRAGNTSIFFICPTNLHVNIYGNAVLNIILFSGNYDMRCYICILLLKYNGESIVAIETVAITDTRPITLLKPKLYREINV
jgi:hypothetical protein